MTRIGLVGPCFSDPKILRRALEFLLDEASADEVIYLGVDGKIDRIMREWIDEVTHGRFDEVRFLDYAAQLILRGSADEIAELLDADQKVTRLRKIRSVPRPPERDVEMVSDRIVLVVYDKAILDEDDIANATLIVYGKSSEVFLKQFGPRYFFTPGPLEQNRVAVIEVDSEQSVSIVAYDLQGTLVFRETLSARATKMQVRD
ncbi:MAG: hypothetical protein AAF355_04415 [Myxococcota bacterium]